ncbi:MAG: tetratricopeptide (TPR) repeat protein [Candidatus Azotimanducaceae bacterium]|jgi:tetratricopeptide (TPR) repeat protein
MGLVGCATVPESPVSETNTGEGDALNVIQVDIAKKPKIAPEPPEYPVAPFQGDSLYQLLVAEVAGFRSDYELALQNYLTATLETQDPGVAARATRLALYLKKDDVARQTVSIWAEKDPSNIDAHRHAADLLLRAGRLEDAIVHMEAIKNLGGLAKFDVFAYRSANLSADQKASLLKAINEMLSRHPSDDQLLFSKAVLLEQTGQLEESLVLADRLLGMTENVNVVILKMTVLGALDRTEEAKKFLGQKVEEQPDNRRLRLILARLYFEQRELEAAKAQYGEALKFSPNDGDVLFALALIALEQKDDPLARRYFEKMVRWDRRSGEAHYYLGGIAERQSNKVEALKAYHQAGTGYEFLPAQARIASILVGDGRWEEARKHLARLRASMPEHQQQLIFIEAQLLADRGLEQEALSFLDEVIALEPNNVDLLYFRAMTGQRFGRLDILEQDLRRVLSVDPDNADAMNALGYTLADLTDRHEEAFELIERALALRPDEPAFIDSMGWVLYRLGDYEKAVTYLRRALALFNNDEVAAHLGEVLWVMGSQREATQIWQEALELAPDSEILKSVMQRLMGIVEGTGEGMVEGTVEGMVEGSDS